MSLFDRAKMAISGNDFPPTKVCSHCNAEKDRDEFYNHTGTSDGKQPNCIQCSKESVKLSNQKKKYKKILQEGRILLNGHSDKDALLMLYLLYIEQFPCSNSLLFDLAHEAVFMHTKFGPLYAMRNITKGLERAGVLPEEIDLDALTKEVNE